MKTIGSVLRRLLLALGGSAAENYLNDITLVDRIAELAENGQISSSSVMRLAEYSGNIPTSSFVAISGTSMSVKGSNLYYSISKDGRYFSLRGELRVGGGTQSAGWSGFTVSGLGIQPKTTRTVPASGFLIQGNKPIASFDTVNYTIFTNGDIRINFYQWGDGATMDYDLVFFGHLEEIR